MKKFHFIVFFAALGLLSAQLALPLHGQASPLPAAQAAAVTGPHVGGDIVINAVDNVKHLPSVAYNSKHDEYLVVWHTSWAIGTRDIRAQRVSARGQLLGSEFTVFENDTHDSAQPSVAYDPVNDRYLVVFIYDTMGDGSDWDLMGRLVPWNGPSAGLTAFPIITWSTSQWNPKVVYAGGIQQEFFVVWNNTSPGGTPPAYVSGKRIKPDGTWVSLGADLTLSDAAVNYINPAVSYNLARNEYLVVWDKVGSSDDIWAVRITGNAIQLGGGPFAIAGWPDNEENPAVAACNMADKYLVAWQSDVGTGGTNWAIYSRFVSGDSTIDGGPIQVAYTTSPEINPSVACSRSGNQYLVAYQQMYTNLKYGIWGRLVSPDHSMEAGFPIISPGSAADRSMPAVAGGQSNYLVAWEHQRDGTSYQDIHGRLVTPGMLFLPLVKRN